MDAEPRAATEVSREQQKQGPQLAQHTVPGNIQRGAKQQSEFPTRAEARTPADGAQRRGHLRPGHMQPQDEGSLSLKGSGQEDSGPSRGPVRGRPRTSWTGGRLSDGGSLWNLQAQEGW